MSIEFAERIIDGMVDENGHCGERGMSQKQFDCIARYLDAEESEWVDAWHGDKFGGRVDFTSTNYVGTVGKYQVVLNEFWHFNRRCTVVEINLRPADEIAAEEARREFERQLREIAKFEHSEWVAEPKERIDMELTLVRDYQYERQAYGYSYGYHPETAHIYTLADAEGNCYVWRTTNDIDIEWYDEDDEWHCITAELGDKVTMRATVKEHGEYKGIRQTVITRPKIKEVQKRAA